MVESNQPPLPTSLFGPARCSPVELISLIEPPDGSGRLVLKNFLKDIIIKLADAVLTTLPGLQASLPHQFIL